MSRPVRSSDGPETLQVAHGGAVAPAFDSTTTRWRSDGARVLHQLLEVREQLGIELAADVARA